MIPLLAIIIFMMNFFSSLGVREGVGADAPTSLYGDFAQAEGFPSGSYFHIT